jgi:hypothetical protein
MLRRKFAPPQLDDYLRASLQRLPDQLCALPAGQVVALPNSFKDEVRKRACSLTLGGQHGVVANTKAQLARGCLQ